jgi:hypothetical protein
VAIAEIRSELEVATAQVAERDQRLMVASIELAQRELAQLKSGSPPRT